MHTLQIAVTDSIDDIVLFSMLFGNVATRKNIKKKSQQQNVLFIDN
jgi:hypothetical protein